MNAARGSIYTFQKHCFHGFILIRIWIGKRKVRVHFYVEIAESSAKKVHVLVHVIGKRMWIVEPLASVYCMFMIQRI